MQLLDFQQTALLNVTTTLNTQQSVLLQSATASGKTVIASYFIKQKAKEKKKVLVLVPFQSLVTQFYGTLVAFGSKASVLHDEITRDKDGNLFVQDWKNPIQITMPVTLINTVNGTNTLNHDPKWKPDYIVIDEAHKGTSLYYQTIRNMYPDAKIFGLTATPYREQNLEGENLQDWYGDNLITTISVKELIALGRLVQPIYHKIKTNAHVVNTWLNMTKGKKTIIFSKDTHHSFAIQKAFAQKGVKAEVITAGSVTDPDNIINPQTPLQRQKIYNDFEHGDVDVLISVAALCEGFDCPRAEVVMLLRTVGNHALYHQMIGRVLRAHILKQNAFVLDFGDNITSYGYIEDYEWSMEEGRAVHTHVEHGTVMTIAAFNRNNRVFHTCDCSHVYDIEQHSVCGQCLTKHNVKVKTTAFDMIREHIDIKDNNALIAFFASLRGMRGSEATRKAFNKRYGKTILNEQTGALTPEFEFLDKIMHVKNGGAFIEFAA
jgi:superfamily II DNA or RNA helicase